MALALDTPVARPLAPSRIRRCSPSSSSLRDGAASVDGMLGGLRERSADELSREALVSALRAAWEEHALLEIRLNEMEEVMERLDKERKGLDTTVLSLQARYDEALSEQSLLEADLVGRDEVLDRLRSRVTEAESISRDATKRALEQEKSFEAERQAMQAQETHLQQRIRTLLSARPSTTASNYTRTVSDLQEELATLNVSHSTILAQLSTLIKELHELRTTNATLAEENEGWEFLLRERTLNGKVREGGLLGARHEETSQGHLHAWDEQTEMDELHSELDAQSPIMDDPHEFARDLDQDRLLSQPTRSASIEASRDVRKASQGENLGDIPVTGAGLDLAAELGRAEVDLSGSEMRVLGRGDEGEALRAEVKSLREENKALTLYCSKIIDRIIAQEGFEHILSVDYKTRRTGSRSASGTGRGSLKDITNVMQAVTPVETTMPTPDAVKEAKKTRPLSMMARALSSGPDKTTAPPSAEPAAKNAKAEIAETKTEKRARRGFSLDFRSLGFGSPSPAATPSEQKPDPALKPLTLPSRTTPMTVSPKPVQARRLERHEEDEDDRRERHHLEATLKLMGVNRPSASPDAPSKPSSQRGKLVKSPARQSLPEEKHPLISSSRPTFSRAASSGSSRVGTPLSRLSSAIGNNDPPLGSLSPEMAALNLSPELAAEAVLKAFDEKEAEQVKALSQGRAVSGYTSPTSGSVRRRSTGRRVGSGDSFRSASGRDVETIAELEEGRALMRGSESISTLWSIGSSHSLDLAPKR